jgi:hypothetical protein
MSFFRHGEIYRSDVGLLPPGAVMVRPLPGCIGCDEFPAGYSLAGCSPAEPASASPTGTIFSRPRLRYKDFLSANGLLNPGLSGGRKFQRGE